MLPAHWAHHHDAVLPVIAFHSLAPPRAVNDMRARIAAAKVSASFSPTSC